MILHLPSDEEILNVNPTTFEKIALQIFHFQAENNTLYKKYLQVLDKNPLEIKMLQEIPFLPIEFFKSHEIISEKTEHLLFFESSGTTQENKSKHFIKDPLIYQKAIAKQFEKNFGSIQEYCILALLPSYLERQNASLVFMCNQWMQLSGNKQSGFYLNQFNALKNLIMQLELKKQKTILIGVSFALLDFAKFFPYSFINTIVIETGGMKGRRKEITRNELHEILQENWQRSEIISEYGMTELLSQCYAFSNGMFTCPQWMQIFVRDTEDPFLILEKNKSGLINVIDLLNKHSCSFIATQDIGKIHIDGNFEVLGRFDKSDVRGCNLLIE